MASNRAINKTGCLIITMLLYCDVAEAIKPHIFKSDSKPCDTWLFQEIFILSEFSMIQPRLARTVIERKLYIFFIDDKVM